MWMWFCNWIKKNNLNSDVTTISAMQDGAVHVGIGDLFKFSAKK